jgi:pimeloyl-ACP methyl ester carboxylesterase
VLCLPGGLCTGAFLEELMAEPALADVRMVAATLPGQGGAPVIGDLSIESCAQLASGLARDFGCDAVLGHSVGANVALEMAASGGFSGPLVLVAPSLSRRDESIVARVHDRLGVVLGRLPFAVALRMMGPAMKGEVPAERRAPLLAELRKNDTGNMRRSLHLYLEYLDRHGSLAPRLCAAGVPTWLIFGEKDDVGLTDEERRILTDCPHTTVVTIPGAGHMVMNQEPGQVAQWLLTALAAR